MFKPSVLKFAKPFNVEVCHDQEENVWVAQCDDLGLVTEAETYEELTERVWDIAPELFEMNGFTDDPACIRISFTQEQSYQDRIAL